MARVFNKDLQAPHRIQNLLSIVKCSSDPLQSEGQLKVTSLIVSPTLQSEVVIYCQPNPPKLELKHEGSTWVIANQTSKSGRTGVHASSTFEDQDFYRTKCGARRTF